MRCLSKQLLITSLCYFTLLIQPFNNINHKISKFLNINLLKLTNEPDSWIVSSIGRVVSPYIEKYNTPKQATIISSNNNQLEYGQLVINSNYSNCLIGLNEFDYIWVISYMHYNKGYKSIVKLNPINSNNQLNDNITGLFTTRAPHRPNPIAISALKIISIDYNNSIIHVYGIDLLNNTPILDIKPYIPAFDSFTNVSCGWMDKIISDPMISRYTGYQTIISSKGAKIRKKKIDKQIIN